MSDQTARTAAQVRTSRKQGLHQMAVGTGVAGAGLGAEAGLNRMARGRPGPIKAVMTGKLSPKFHGGQLGGKLLARGMQFTGAPLAMVGAKHVLFPKKVRREVDYNKDVLKPIVRRATFTENLDETNRELSKASSLTTMPNGSKVLIHEGRLLDANSPAGKRVARSIKSMEADHFAHPIKRSVSRTTVEQMPWSAPFSGRSANPWSDKGIRPSTLRVYRRPITQMGSVKAATGAAVGVAGAAYLHHKMLGKALTHTEDRRLDAHRHTGRVLSLTSGTLGLSALALRAPDAAKFAVKHGVKAKPLAHLARSEMRATKLSNTLGVGAIGVGSANSFNYAAQSNLERKRDTVRKDHFLEHYKNRISPDAERGYHHLKEGRNESYTSAGGQAVLGGLSGWALSHELRQKRISKPTAIATGAGAIAAGYSAYKSARKGRRWNDRMDRIKSKARSRQHAGLYGPGRDLSPVDTSSARARNLAKSFNLRSGSWDASSR